MLFLLLLVLLLAWCIDSIQVRLTIRIPTYLYRSMHIYMCVLGIRYCVHFVHVLCCVVYVCFMLRNECVLMFDALYALPKIMIWMLNAFLYLELLFIMDMDYCFHKRTALHFSFPSFSIFFPSSFFRVIIIIIIIFFILVLVVPMLSFSPWWYKWQWWTSPPACILHHGWAWCSF